MNEVLLDQLNDVGDVTYYNNKPFTGIGVSYHPNRKIYYKINFVNGLKEGELLIFRENGKLHSSYVYKNDLRNGEHKRYNYKGSLVLEQGFYLDDLKTGEWVKYFENGKIDTKQSYVNDKENGQYLSYYESGQLKAQGHFLNCIQTNSWKYFFESGALKGSIDYPGRKILYNENGSIKSDAEINQMGFSVGRTIYNFDDGSSYFKGYYNKECNKEGLFFKYREGNNILDSIEFYDNGFKELSAYNFNNQGKLMSVVFCRYGLPIAKHTSMKKLDEYVSDSKNKFDKRIVLDFDFEKKHTNIYIIDKDKNIFKYEDKQAISLNKDEEVFNRINTYPFKVLEKNLHLSYYIREDQLIENYIELFDKTAHLIWD